MVREKSLYRNYIFIIITVAILLLSFACASQPVLPTPATPSTTQPEKTPKYGGILKRSYSTDADQLGDPVARPFATNGITMAAPAIETLMRFDDKGNMVPLLASSWKVSSDLTSITLTLQKGIKFHDGTPFNAEACKWNLDRYRTSSNPELKSVSSVDNIDDNTLKLNLSEWSSTLLDSFAYVPGMMISPTAFRNAGTTDKERSEWCQNNPVGTGPFKFKSWNRQVKISYVKNTDYWQKGKPYLDGVEFTIITDLMVQLASLKAGDVDEYPIVEPKDVKDLESSGKFTITKGEMSTTVWLMAGDSINKESPFYDLRVRQAIDYAVDKKAIMDALFLGYAKLTNQYAPSVSWGYNPDVKGYSYNPDKAKQLLTEAGYPNGFKTKIYSPNWGSYFPSPPPAIQQYLKKVGIDTEIVSLGMAPLTVYQRGGWKNALCVLPGTMALPDIAMNLLSYLSNKSYVNTSIIFPDDYNTALSNAFKAPDLNTKKKWVWEAQKLMTDKYDLANIYCTQVRLFVASKKVHDSGIGYSVYTQWTPENAWIEQ